MLRLFSFHLKFIVKWQKRWSSASFKFYILKHLNLRRIKQNRRWRMDVGANGGALQTREGQHNDFHPWIVSPRQPSPAQQQPDRKTRRESFSSLIRKCWRSCFPAECWHDGAARPVQCHAGFHSTPSCHMNYMLLENPINPFLASS